MANIKNGFAKHSVSLHFKNIHNKDLSLLQFCGKGLFKLEGVQSCAGLDIELD